MKRLLSSLFLLSLFLLPVRTLAEDQALPVPSVKDEKTTGNVSCFDYYQFGSVQADLETDLSETVPGATIHFKGKIKNANDYPVVDGTLFIKVFLKNEGVFAGGDGNPVVDQFSIDGKWNIPANGEKEVAFAWHVPENATGGDYYVATFFNTEGRYNLSGLSFTDDVIGNSVQFKVNSQEKAVYLDKTKTTLNGEDHHFAAYPLHFNMDAKVEIKTMAVNPTDKEQIVQLTWEEYTWDSMRKENLKNKKFELIQIPANQSKDISYTVNPQNTSVSYVIATTKDQYGKSIQGIRFVRDDIEETRINFPSLTSFPLKKGEVNSLFACAHSTNLPKVPGNILTLTLRDDNQNVIHEYKYEGDITGSMGGFKDDFTPSKSYDKVFLTATLQRNNQVVEEVTIPYDCSVIDKNTCNPIGSLFGAKATTKNIAIIIGALLSLIAILAILITKMKHQKRNNRFKVFFLALMLGASFLVPSGAEGKGVSWSKTETDSLAYYWDCSGANCNGSNGWTRGLSAPTVGISYNANVYNADTGVLIPDGSTVVVGTRLRFVPATSSDFDITWFASGASNDSPYGHWISNASAPSFACLNGDRSASGVADEFGLRTYDVYNPFSVNPTSNSISTGGTTATLTNQGSNVYRVDGPGVVNAQVTFASTYGKFYYRYKPLTRLSNDTLNVGQCYGNQTPMERITASYAPPFCIFDCGGAIWSYDHTSYQLDIPQQTIPFTFNATGGNTPPNPPTLTGPTSGSTSVSYSFATQATDPDGDMVKYGIDWDNNGTIDEWTGLVASNTAVNTNHQWATSGTYTFKALTQDNNGATSGWSTPLTITIQTIVNGVCGAANSFPTTNPPTIGLCISGTPTAVTPGVAPGPYSWTCTGSGGGADMSCGAPYLEPTPTVDLKINGSDGPITIGRDGNLNLTWGNIPNAATCTGTGNNWSGGKFITGGNDNLPATAASLYTLTCTNSQGISASDSISVTLQPTLKICQNSCSSSIEPPSSFSMQKGDTKDLIACYNDATGCTDSTGDVTTSAAWGDGGSNPISLSGSTPKRVTADNPGSEDVNASYNSSTVTKNVTVTCTDGGACQRDPNYNKLCQKDTYTVVDSCGVTQNCNGTKTCDYNWKEVAP